MVLTPTEASHSQCIIYLFLNIYNIIIYTYNLWELLFQCSGQLIVLIAVCGTFIHYFNYITLWSTDKCVIISSLLFYDDVTVISNFCCAIFITMFKVRPFCWWCCLVLLTLCIHYFTSLPWPQQNCPLWNNYSFFNWIESSYFLLLSFCFLPSLFW